MRGTARAGASGAQAGVHCGLGVATLRPGSPGRSRRGPTPHGHEPALRKRSVCVWILMIVKGFQQTDRARQKVLKIRGEVP